MPELPEVETVVRVLRPLLVGRRIVAAPVVAAKMAAPAAVRKAIVGRTVVAVDRRAKWIVATLAGEGSQLLVHLGMTGRLGVRPAAAPVEKHTHVRMELDNGMELRFVDPRRFGVFEAVAPADMAARLAALGPEPQDMRPDDFAARLQRTKRGIKAALMDPKLIAGLGNIYAEEACHLARIHPAKTASRLRPDERLRLLADLRDLLDRATELRGTSVHTFLGADDAPGGFQERLLVYGREGQPCGACGTSIKLSFEIVSGRSTRWCPRCQPGRTPRKRATGR